jgi:hypothetical protein
MAEEKKASKSDQEKLLATARDRYKRGLEAEEANRTEALNAVRFRNLEQWDPDVKRARESDPEGARPCPVVDKTGQFLRQVVNDEKQNRPSIKIRPVDDKGDPEVAEVLQGLVRHIEDISGADLAYDTAYEQAVDGGFGYFRILTEYCDSRSMDQEIKIKRIRNRFQVVLDDARQEPDGSDSKWGFIVDKMHRDEFKATFPKADPCDFEASGDFGEWIEKDYVLIAEYFHFEEKDATLLQWASGAVTVEGEPAPQTDFIGEKVINQRKTKLKQLKWKKISAKEVLQERDLPGELIPIVEVIGEEIDEQGKSHKNGLLKRAMEPQRIHNFASANFIENVGLAPRSQWVAEERQIEGHEDKYKTANRRNISVLPYKAVLEDGVLVPRRSARSRQVSRWAGRPCCRTPSTTSPRPWACTPRRPSAWGCEFRQAGSAAAEARRYRHLSLHGQPRALREVRRQDHPRMDPDLLRHRAGRADHRRRRITANGEAQPEPAGSRGRTGDRDRSHREDFQHQGRQV